jgi:hypothetical protein
VSRKTIIKGRPSLTRLTIAMLTLGCSIPFIGIRKRTYIVSKGGSGQPWPAPAAQSVVVAR